MTTTLEKVKRLEQYLVISGSNIDPVLDMSIDKLLVRELTRILGVKTRLFNQISEFEKLYSMTHADFYQCYKRGEMGDDMDFIEWAATIEMLTHVEKKLELLQIGYHL